MLGDEKYWCLELPPQRKVWSHWCRSKMAGDSDVEEPSTSTSQSLDGRSMVQMKVTAYKFAGNHIMTCADVC